MIGKQELIMNNIEIRELIEKRRLKHLEVANALGINPCTFSKWLRLEVTEKRKQEIIKAINSIE